MPTQYVVTDEELIAVANAIRTKGDTEADLEWPSGFVSAIEDLEIGSGGGTSQIIQCPPIKIPTYNGSNYLKIIDGWASDFIDGNSYIHPLDSQGNVLDVDWSKPFEIFVRFKYSSTISHSMVLFGSTSGYYNAPSIELSSNGAGIWCGFSLNGNTWGKSLSFNSSDGLIFQTNNEMTAKATFDGTDYSVTITDGVTSITKTVTTGGPHYHLAGYVIGFGGIAKSSQHNARYVSMYLPEMYIESEGTKVWKGYEVQSGGGPDFSHEEAFLLTDYIASSGTQWIDTGYIVKDNSVFDIVCYDGYYSGRLNSVYGVRNGDQSGGCSLWFTGDTSQAQFQWSSGIGANEMYLSDKAYNHVKLHIIAKKSGLSLCSHSITSKPSDVYTDEKIANTKTGSATQTYSLYLFGLNEGGSEYGTLTRGNVRIYRFRIYEGNELVHEFVPWTDTNNVVCLKDTVTGNLKYNAGTGTFTRGTDS